MPTDLTITPELSIPAWELEEQFVRASGPGGQHVNKVATAVQLRWNLERSSLPAPIKARLRQALRHRLTQDGDILISASPHRSQARNREAARTRLAQILADALTPRKRRVATRPGRVARERRLSTKRQRSQTKTLRGTVRDDG